MNPANNIIGITHQVSIAPPVRRKSTIFIAASIPIIEIRDIPIATLNASFNIICLDKIIVSRIIEVIIPLNMASIIMFIVDQPESVNTNWNAAIVPKSPIEQPIKHHIVLYADLPHTSRSDQLKSIEIGVASSTSQQDLTSATSAMCCRIDSGFSIVVYCSSNNIFKNTSKFKIFPLDFQE